MNNKVVCINNKLAESRLTVNKVYDIKREGEDIDTIVILGDDNIRYVMPRAYFYNIKVIKEVRYTKESCAYIPNMVIGDTYEVIEETKDGFYIVIDSKRMTTRVPKHCFEEDSPSRNITLNLKFDTSELQDKLEKALYHLKELNKIMGEIGNGDVKVKVD